MKDVINKKISLTHRLGDLIERLGEKIIKAGAPKVGRKIYDAGDKVEHLNERVK